MATRKKISGIPETYVKALGGQDPLMVLATTPDRIRKAIKGLTDEQLATKPLPKKWSMRDIIAHLADGEVIVGSRVRFIAAHDEPPIPSYDQDAFVARLGASNASATDLLDDFSMARAVNLGLFDRLPKKSFDRVGIHAERGPESIRKLIYMCAGHDLHHVAQIETIRVGLFPKKGKKGATRATARPSRKRS